MEEEDDFNKYTIQWPMSWDDAVHKSPPQMKTQLQNQLKCLVLVYFKALCCVKHSVEYTKR